MSGTDERDPYNLQRFVDAQDPEFPRVCAELQEGRKRGHWMWFIFPQIHGLGDSSMARWFAIASLDEAKAYLKHPVLGPRLRECCRLVISIEGCPIEKIFAWPDYLKFGSSMTLFARATSENQVFTSALNKYFEGESDPLTLERL
jgi:uncharacterized protein (DUF1810 family)